MSRTRRSLAEDVRTLADGFEAAADAEEVVVSRVRTRLARPSVGAFAVVGAAAVLLLGALVLRSSISPPNTAAPVMPELVGIFRSVEPDEDGRCVAVRLYDTTPQDGRTALWAWTGTDGCQVRVSNLTAGTGTAMALALPASGEHPSRDGIGVAAAADVAAPLNGLSLVLDPEAGRAGEPNAEMISAFWSTDDLGGRHTLQLVEVDELHVPYRVN